jgi:hypothetical protein
MESPIFQCEEGSWGAKQKSGDRKDMYERLDPILSWDDVPTGSSELDRLYLHILRGASLDKDLLRQILGFLVRCPSHIESFSNLVDLPPHDVIILLRDVGPIIHLPDPKSISLL